MAETTQIHPDKIRAYLATDYRLGHAAQRAVLYIEQRSERLARLCAHKGVNCCAFWSTLILNNRRKRICHLDWGQRKGGTILRRSPNRGAGRQCSTGVPLLDENRGFFNRHPSRFDQSRCLGWRSHFVSVRRQIPHVEP